MRYELRDFLDKFEIDRNTGDIRTKVKLDREERKSYPLTVVAYDGKESALTLDGQPNRSAKRFQIEVADVNDNAPFFPQSEYFAEIAENADIGAKVSELTALDNDTESQLTYDIVSGNVGMVFSIEAQTGLLKVQQPLDYETTKSYNLIVEVDDGKQKANTKVNVKIINVNDNKPQFRNSNPEQIYGIVENTVPLGPIVRINASDPDYDPNTAEGPMKITYTLSGSHADSFQINPLGELSIVRPLDRDLPSGRKDWSIFVVAQDELDGVRLENTLEVVIFLDDVNDNAPFLDMTRVVWNENQPQGRIVQLNASDYDEAKNGPPFTMKMADTAEDIVKTAFRIDGSPTSSWSLMAARMFDREERKEYAVPIVISDSGQPTSLTATSTLTVVIGDENDNPMSDGSSSILVYNYRNSLPDTEIGRVFVQDADDWVSPLFDHDDDVYSSKSIFLYCVVGFAGQNICLVFYRYSASVFHSHGIWWFHYDANPHTTRRLPTQIPRTRQCAPRGSWRNGYRHGPRDYRRGGPSFRFDPAERRWPGRIYQRHAQQERPAASEGGGICWSQGGECRYIYGHEQLSYT